MKLIVITAVALVLAPATASAAVYAGGTSRGDPIAITLAKSGKLQKIGISWIAQCQSGRHYTFGGMLVSTRKRPSLIMPGDNPLFGSIKKNKLKATSIGALVFADGSSGSVSQRISGKLKPTYAAGTWSATIDVLDPDGNPVDRCSTGTFRWTARRGPTVYGGSTTQGEPVVVEVAPSRTRVTYFGFAWDASCPDGSLRFAENLGNFALTEGGAFGDQWTDDYPFSDGSGKASFSYAVSGKLRKGRGSGTLSIDIEETDSGGAPVMSCHSNPVRWNVSQ